jgi:hypothetical protein
MAISESVSLTHNLSHHHSIEVMFQTPHPSFTTNTRSSARIAGNVMSGMIPGHQANADGQSDDGHDDEDYIMGGSVESGDSSFSSEGVSSSDFIDPESSVLSGRSKRTNKRKQKASKAPVRSVETAASRSTVATAYFPLLSIPKGFKFLELESYVCHCASPLSTSADQEPSSHDKSSPRSRCKVLQYFGMVFLENLGVVYCPTHDFIVPMSEWVAHVYRSHLDWISAHKKQECLRMAEHVAISHELSLEETAEDLNLPVEIEELLVVHTMSLSHLRLNYQCPLGCGLWIAEDKSSRFPERYIREKHIRSGCRTGPCDLFRDITLDEPRWVHKVRISAKSSVFHSFVLPHDWERSDNEDHTAAPEAPSLGDVIPSVRLDHRQDWPLKLGWPAYVKEIAANDHVVALRNLILQPRCDCRSSTPNSHFLEKGLHLVDHALVKYFRTAMLFLHSKHKRVVDAITSG